MGTRTVVTQQRCEMQFLSLGHCHHALPSSRDELVLPDTPVRWDLQCHSPRGRQFRVPQRLQTPAA